MQEFLRKQLELLKAKQSIFTLMWELRSKKAHTVVIFLYQQRGLCLHPASLDGARPPCVHRLSHLRNTQRWLLHQHGWQPPRQEKHSLFAFSFAGTDKLTNAQTFAKIPPCTVPYQCLRQWKHREPLANQATGGQGSSGGSEAAWMFIRLIMTEELCLRMKLWHYHQASSGLIEPDSLLHLSEIESFSLHSFVSFSYLLCPSSCLHPLPPQYSRWPQDHKQLKVFNFKGKVQPKIKNRFVLLMEQHVRIPSENMN